MLNISVCKVFITEDEITNRYCIQTNKGPIKIVSEINNLYSSVKGLIKSYLNDGGYTIEIKIDFCYSRKIVHDKNSIPRLCLPLSDDEVLEFWKHFNDPNFGL